MLNKFIRRNVEPKRNTQGYYTYGVPLYGSVNDAEPVRKGIKYSIKFINTELLKGSALISEASKQLEKTHRRLRAVRTDGAVVKQIQSNIH